MEFVAKEFDKLRDIISTLAPHIAAALIPTYSVLIEILSQERGVDVLKFLVETLDMDLSSYVVDIRCCMIAPGLEDYISSSSKCPRIDASADTNKDILYDIDPHQVVRGAKYIADSTIHSEHLKQYCDNESVSCRLCFADCIALRMLYRAVKRPDYWDRANLPATK